jgi:hypothetical protein
MVISPFEEQSSLATLQVLRPENVISAFKAENLRKSFWKSI